MVSRPSRRSARALVGLFVALTLLSLGLAPPASAEPDGVTPVLTSISLSSPGPFTRGDTVKLPWAASDDSGITRIHLMLIDSVGRTHSLEEGNRSSGTVTRVIDTKWANGPVRVDSIDLTDGSGTMSTYHADGTMTYVPAGIGPSSHSFDFSRLGFSTHDTGADVSPPVLTGISLHVPGPFVAQDVVTVDWTVSDEGTGVARLQVFWRDKARGFHELLVNRNVGSGTGSTTLDSTWALGQVTIDQVLLTDGAGNTARYYADGRLTTVPTGGQAHSLNLAALSFEIQPRLLVRMSQTPPAISPPNATFGFEVKDRDATVDQLTVACDLDGSAIPCTATGAQLRDLSSGDHHLTVNVTDPGGNHASATHHWIADGHPPLVDVAPPSSPVLLTPRIALRWGGHDDGAAGIESYDVTYGLAGARGSRSHEEPPAWQQTTATSGTSPEIPAGSTACFQVRARDRVGNLSGWSAARCVTRPLDDPALARGGLWSRVGGSSLYGGSALQSSTTGAKVSVGGVRVRRVGVLATTCRTCGVVGLYVGAELVGKFSLSASATHYRQALLVPWFASRYGTVSVRVLSRGKPVVIDGLVLQG